MKEVRGRRFGARPGVGPASGPASPPGQLLDRMLAHFVAVGGRPGGRDRLASSADAVLSVLRQAVDAGRWQQVLELVRLAEPAFQLSARWGAWEAALEAARQAARALGDEQAEGWALHQLGIRALATGDDDAARWLLSQALAIRDRSGPPEAAALTGRQLAGLLARSTT